jgi:two-component system CheB/CheR fusion protein
MTKRFQIIGVGASADGLDAVRHFFSNVACNGYTSFIVVFHLPINVPTYLDVILSKATTLPVRLLTASLAPKPDHVYVLPGNKRVKVAGGILLVRDRKPSEVINRAISELFISLAEDQRQRAGAILLAGIGDDASQSAQAILINGGMAMVQDPHTSEFRAMPVVGMAASDSVVISAPGDLGKVFGLKMPSAHR